MFLRRAAAWAVVGGTANSTYGDEHERRMDAMKSAFAQDAADVERLFSEKPILVRVGAQEYLLPRNHLTPKGAAERDTVRYSYLAFYLFLPDYGGYTKDNWQEGAFHEQLIDVMTVQPVDKNAKSRTTKGEIVPASPASYGEPKAQFQNIRRLLEKTPSLHLAGLEGHRAVNHPSVKTITWVGTRANGEFFFFRSPFAPGEGPVPGVQYPHCRVRYYSEKEDLYIAYAYKQQHIERWREIDTRIWQKIKEWRQK